MVEVVAATGSTKHIHIDSDREDSARHESPVPVEKPLHPIQAIKDEFKT